MEKLGKDFEGKKGIKEGNIRWRTRARNKWCAFQLQQAFRMNVIGSYKENNLGYWD